MCLAVPGQVVRWIDRDPLLARAVVAFAGVTREVSMACVPEAREDDYVLVHAGIAISRIDEQRAHAVLESLAEIEDVLDDESALAEKAPLTPPPQRRTNPGSS